MELLHNNVLAVLGLNNKINILRIFTGITAVNNIKYLLFLNNTDDANIWINRWSIEELENSTLVIYTRLKRTKKNLGFKFIIGDIDTGSIIGEEHDYIRGMSLYTSLLTPTVQ